MAGRFETRLEEGPPVVADGGMGALLTAAVPRLRSPEEANLRAPEAVVSLHVSFINAGAAVLEDRGADVLMLETFFELEELVDAIAAVRSVSSLPVVALLTFDEEAET